MLKLLHRVLKGAGEARSRRGEGRGGMGTAAWGGGDKV